jgi:molybdopterin-binding protein
MAVSALVLVLGISGQLSPGQRAQAGRVHLPLSAGLTQRHEPVTLGSRRIRVDPVVTNSAIEALGLKEGMKAYAVIKASSVLLGVD